MTMHGSISPRGPAIAKATAQLVSLFFCTGLIAGLASAEARGQDAALNISGDYKNSVGIGGGGGWSYSSDSPNISISADYVRKITGPWGLNLVIGYDKEFPEKDGKRVHSHNISLMAGVTYQVTEHIGLVAGFSRSVFEKDKGKDWKMSGNDWAVGAGIAYSYPINDRVEAGPGFTVAYDFDSKEVRSEIEMNISYSF